MGLGELGEAFVAQWLVSQGWRIVACRWRCQGGEIDLIGDRSGMLAFIEVKTRTQGNWDENGLLAITTTKQRKICQAAALFLAQYPDFSSFTCRFDVALVSARWCQSPPQFPSIPFTRWEQGYLLTLQDYLEAAFMGDND